MRKLLYIVVLLLFTVAAPTVVRTQEALTFLETSTLNVILTDTYLVRDSVFLQNNSSTEVTVHFIVRAEDSGGPKTIYVGSEDANVPLGAGDVRLFRLRIITTNKEPMTPSSDLSSRGYLVAMTDKPNVKAALRPISIYREPARILEYLKFRVPLGLTVIVMLSAGALLWWRAGISPSALMKAVKFDLKESLLSDFVIGTSVFNGVLGLGVVHDALKSKTTMLMGLYGLAIIIGPVAYRLTLKSNVQDRRTGYVFMFLVACAFTLLGGYGALAVALLVFDGLIKSSVVPAYYSWPFTMLLAFLALGISVYAVRAIFQTVVTQVRDEQVKPRRAAPAVRERAALL